MKLKKFVKNLLNIKDAEAYLQSLDSQTLTDLIMRTIKDKSDHIDAKEAITFVMDIDSRLYNLAGFVSTRYGNGLSSKHKHIKYHDFFTSNLNKGENVLDIGSSNGELATDMAKKVTPGVVYGIEIEQWHVDIANERNKLDNLKVVLGDATKDEDLPNMKFDAITLSNVLEHIENRPQLLKKLVQKYRPKKVLIRVPMFERDWRVPLKKELGLDSRLDETHFIEFTSDEFKNEMNEAGLNIKDLTTKWGEFWAVLEPKN